MTVPPPCIFNTSVFVAGVLLNTNNEDPLLASDNTAVEVNSIKAITTSMETANGR